MHLERMVPNIERDLKADHPMTWDSYHSKADIDAYLTYLADKYPDLVSKPHFNENILNTKKRLAAFWGLYLFYLSGKRSKIKVCAERV